VEPCVREVDVWPRIRALGFAETSRSFCQDDAAGCEMVLKASSLPRIRPLGFAVHISYPFALSLIFALLALHSLLTLRSSVSRPITRTTLHSLASKANPLFQVLVLPVLNAPMNISRLVRSFPFRYLSFSFSSHLISLFSLDQAQVLRNKKPPPTRSTSPTLNKGKGKAPAPSFIRDDS